MCDSTGEGVGAGGTAAQGVRSDSTDVVPVRRPTQIARELGGDLPCASCRYNLRGLSVLSVCPECGVPVRATILAAVDPYAEVLRPISWPRATAVGLVLWSAGALAAALLTWVQRAAEVAELVTDQRMALRGAASVATLCIVLSAVGALVLVRPHGGVRGRPCAAALAGVLAMAGLAAAYWRLHGEFDATRIRPYFQPEVMLAERTYMRLLMGALIAVAVLGLRPNARLLAGRSLLMRMGYVDRQPLRAMAVALGVAALGDLLHLLVPSMPAGLAAVATNFGKFLIAVGSMLFTVGLVGIVVDVLRLAPLILRPPLSIEKVLGPEPAPVAGPSV